MSHTYIGKRTEDSRLEVEKHVFGPGKPTCEVSTIDPRLDLFNHSPTGFECGYEGSGPAQLALAILADHFLEKMRRDDPIMSRRRSKFASWSEETRAVVFHQEFKRLAISPLNRELKTWEITAEQVDLFVETITETRPELVQRWELEVASRRARDTAPILYAGGLDASRSGLTYREIKERIETFTEKQLDMVARWAGDERGGVIREVFVTDELEIGEAGGEGVAPISSYDGEERAMILSVHKKQLIRVEEGTPFLLVD